MFGYGPLKNNIDPDVILVVDDDLTYAKMLERGFRSAGFICFSTSNATDAIKILNRAGAFGGVASIEQVGKAITERPKGKSIFTNVTAELLTIVLAVEIWVENDEGSLEYSETIYVRIPIFNEMLEGEYWEYDNNGLKLLQVWIYDNSTDVSEGDEDLPELPQEPQP